MLRCCFLTGVSLSASSAPKSAHNFICFRSKNFERANFYARQGESGANNCFISEHFNAVLREIYLSKSVFKLETSG